jgi:hypothetical protein
MSPRARSLTATFLTFGPACAWLAFLLLRYGPERDLRWTLAYGLLSSLGVLGLSTVFVAWLPWAAERLGLRRFGAWLRTWWDEDAR